MYPPYPADLNRETIGKEVTMATFYLLPSRRTFGQRFGEFLGTAFPGLHWQHHTWPDLAEAVAAFASIQPGAYVVFREDLADELQPEASIVRDFGAEPGDEIIEVHAPGSAGRRWHITATEQAVA